MYDAPEADRRISATPAAAEALWLLVLPDSVRRFVRAILSFFEGSGGDAVLRVIGFLTVVLGAALIYVGVFVV